jgi:hypothetical protein
VIDEHAIRSLVEGNRLGIPRDMCYRPAPGTNRTVVCARPRGGDGRGWGHAHRRERYHSLLARTG